MSLTPKSPRPRSAFRTVVALVVVAVLILLFVTPAGKGFLFLGELMGSGLLYGSDWIYPRYVDRFRLTITVNVDGHDYTGSSVYEITSKPGPKWLAPLGNIGHPGLVGDALFIDLGKRGALVLTLEPRLSARAGIVRPEDLLHVAIRHLGGGQPFPDDDYQGAPDEVDLPTWELWRMLYFKNPLDPDSYIDVDPENIDQQFGLRIRFASIKIESTNDNITRGISKYLPWLKKLGFFVSLNPPMGLIGIGTHKIADCYPISSFERGEQK